MSYATRRFAAGELVAQKYLLLNLIGRGASGEVFRARNILAGNLLALKLLVEEAGSESELVKRFFREARAINRIGHPNIVSVFDAGYAEAVPYIAMEYLGGESLARTLDRLGRLPLAAAVAVMLSVLDALGAAHQAGIVHRDLKPENVFLQALSGHAPQVKLLDFGVAKIHDDGDTSIKTASGMILGTPDYLSPEQITGESEVDGRSDLFAAGALMFELLTGRRPFHGPTFVSTTYHIVHEPAPGVVQAGGPEDVTLEHVLARALAKKPGERHASAVELARELEAIAPDHAVRDAALRDLGVTCSMGDEPALSSERAASEPDTAAVRPVPSGEGSGRVEIEPETDGVGFKRRTQPSSPGSSRTWSNLPLVGKRRDGEEPSRNVRGAALLAIDRAIANRYGGDVRDDIIGVLPRRTRDLFRAGAPAPEAWYPVAQIATYLQGCNQVAVHDDAERWRALGYAGVETDLLTLLRSARGRADGFAALRAALPVMAGFFDFGRWALEGAPDLLHVEVAGFFGTPRSLHDWLAGVIEHAARSCGRPYRVAVATGAAEATDGRVEFLATVTG